MAEDNARDLTTHAFELPEGFTLLDGLLILNCWDEENQSIVRIEVIGDPSPALKVGMLTTALDRERDKMRVAWKSVD